MLVTCIHISHVCFPVGPAFVLCNTLYRKNKVIVTPKVFIVKTCNYKYLQGVPELCHCLSRYMQAFYKINLPVETRYFDV